MELKFLKDEKNEIEVEISDVTLAEILRVYLNKDSEISFAAWKREHMTKTPVLKVQSDKKDVKKAVKEAIKSVSADLGSF